MKASRILDVYDLVSSFGSMSCGRLRSDEPSQMFLAGICKLDPQYVGALARRSHPDLPVAQAFAPWWPDPRDCEVEAFHHRTVASCREDLLAILVLATDHDIPPTLVRDELRRSHGRLSIRSFLERLRVDVRVISRRPAVDVREDDEAIILLAKHMNSIPALVRTLLEQLDDDELVEHVLTPRAIPSQLSRPDEIAGQGSEEHRSLQGALCRAGTTRGYCCYTDRGYRLGETTRKPDVSWHRFPGVPYPFRVFEVELGAKSGLNKSWETLEKFHAFLNCQVILVAPRESLELAEELRPIYLRSKTAVHLLSANELLTALRVHGVHGVEQHLRVNLPEG